MINITSNGQKRFKTKNKLCTENIDVNINVTPVLQSKSTTINTTITADSGYDGLSSVAVNVPTNIPIEISTDAGMEAVLIAANVGKAYKFTGTTGTYTNGDIYIVEEN